MIAAAFRHTALPSLSQAAHVLVLAPILLAALIGVVPLLIPCLACRCCREVFARIRTALTH